MRHTLGVVLVILLVVFGVMAEDVRFDRGLGDPLYHLRTASGDSLVITVMDANITRPISVFEQELVVYTPQFSGRLILGGSQHQILVVQEGRVTEKLSGGSVRIPENGFLAVGYGRSVAFFNLISVGDQVEIVERSPISPRPLPTVAVAGNGNFMDIHAWNRGRRAGELIVYTRDFGSHTFTNAFGIEVVVQDEEVVYVKAYGTEELLEIPEGGYVLSGHGDGRFFIEGHLKLWEMVIFE